MAKIPFSKLNVKIDNEVSILHWEGYEIEVKKYLSMNDKAEMISKVINLSADDIGYYNPLKIKMFLTLETIYNYTNISFTSKQKEDFLKLYDMVLSSGLFGKVIELIPEDEWKDLQNTVWHTISNIYDYRTSILGILDTVKSDYSNMELNAESIKENLSNPENLGFLRDVLGQLG
jgi:hypothetical protein